MKETLIYILYEFFLQIVFFWTSMMRESSLFIETDEVAGETFALDCVEEVLVPVAPVNVGGVVINAEFIPLKKYLINFIFSNYFILVI